MIFSAALELTGRERDAYLESSCADDVSLRRDVELLLEQDAREEATTVLEARGMGRELLASEIAREHGGAEGHPRADPKFVGPYSIRRRIAEGGMGVVYLAEQDHPRRRVALKVIKSGIFTEELLRRFEFEAELLGRLQHPGIAGIYDAGEAQTETGRQPYFAMEYVEGVPLTEHASRRALGTRERLVLLARICDAVHHAHQHGIVHRDLKPGNILVVDERVVPGATPTADGGEPVGQPKVLDFGVSRLIQDRPADAHRLTRTGYVVGTVAYMSPEQAGGEKSIDTRSDVYSLGVIAFELLSGELPHDCAELPFVSALRMIQDRPAPRLDSVCAECRGDISIIVGKALAQDREHRYASAAALADDIRRYLSQQPIAARAPTLGYQLNRFVRRNKAVVFGAAIAVLSLVLGLGLAIRAQHEEARQRGVAERQTAEAQQSAYAALVQLAASYSASGDVNAARRRLDATPPELRAWEHEYLASGLEDELSHEPMDVAENHVPALSADDAFAVFAVGPRMIRAMDLLSGEWTDHELPFATRGAMCLLDDRQSVLVADTECAVHRIDLTRARPPRLLFTSEAPIRVMELVPRRLRVVLVASDERVVEVGGWADVVDVETGEVISRISDLGHVTAVDVSPDGASVALGGRDGRIYMHDLASGERRYELAGKKHWVGRITFSPSGGRFASTDPAHGIRVWDTDDGQLARVFDTAQSVATALRFFPDDDTLYSGHGNGRVRRWSIASGECEWMTSGREQPDSGDRTVLKLAFPAGGDLMHVVARDGVSVRPIRPPVPTILHHDTGVWPYAYDVTFSPGGRHLASCGWDGKVRIWNSATRSPVTVLDCPQAAHYARYFPDGDRLLVGAGEGYGRNRVEVWDARRYRRLAAVTGDCRKARAVILPGGDTVAMGIGPELRVADGWTLAARATRLLEDEIWSIACSADGSRVACGLVNGTVVVLDTATWATLHRLDAHAKYVSALAFSPDGSVLATGGSDATLNLWDVASGRRVTRIVSPECIEILALTYTADGRRLLVGSRHPAIVVRDAATGRELLSLEGHTDYVHGLAFSPDDRMLASASGDNTIRIWDARPLADRIRERDRALAAERAARPHVERLLAELGSIDAVLEAVDDDPDARNVALGLRLAEPPAEPSQER